MDPALPEHRHHQLAHGVLDLLRREHPHAARLLVHVELDPRDVPQGPLVVLRLEAQVPLDEHEHPRALEPHPLPDPADVPPAQRELPPGV